MTELASSDYPLLNVMWTMFAFFLWLLWIWLLVTIFSDLFRRKDMSGLAKGGWTVFVLVLPILGALIYLTSQGRSMEGRARADQEAAQQNFDSYVRSVGANGQPTTEISHAKELLDSGAITTAEFEKIKAKALAS